MKQQGFFWHVHHEILVEWCHSYDGRAKYIRTQKAVGERKLRIRLFKPVRGSLPDAVLKAGAADGGAGVAFGKAGVAFDKAAAALDKAGIVYKKAGAAVYKKADIAYNKADIAYEEARDASDKARAAYHEVLIAHWSEIEALHKVECPDCPWNGETIFPSVKKR